MRTRRSRRATAAWVRTTAAWVGTTAAWVIIGATVDLSRNTCPLTGQAGTIAGACWTGATRWTVRWPAVQPAVRPFDKLTAGLLPTCQALGNPIGNPIGNAIGNSIGNKKMGLTNVKFPDKLIFLLWGPGDSWDPPGPS